VNFTLRPFLPGKEPLIACGRRGTEGEVYFCHCFQAGSEAEQANWPKLPTHLVGIATRYGLDGPGIESRWGGARFSAPVQTGPGARPASFTMGSESFPE
jgi:hypothetical protein